MDKVRELIRKERPNIKDSSIEIYIRNLKKINDGKVFGNLDFLKDVDKVMKIIQQKKDDGNERYSKASQKMMLASILVVLRNNEKFKKQYDKFLEMAHKYSKEYYDELKDNLKTQRQSENWVNLDKLTKVLNHYIKLIRKKKIGKKESLDKKDKDLLQSYLVSALYLLQPPRRNVYANVKILTEPEYNDLSKEEINNNNYLVIKSRNKKYFSFGDYKTNKHYGTQKIDLSSKLNSVINLWLKYNKDKEWLLYNKNGSKMSKNNLTKYLNKVFSVSGKNNISSTMLRHIYISDNINMEEYKKMKEIADKMGHSIKEQNNYNKKD